MLLKVLSMKMKLQRKLKVHLNQPFNMFLQNIFLCIPNAFEYEYMCVYMHVCVILKIRDDIVSEATGRNLKI